MNYVKYDTTTGEITQWGFCDPEPFQSMLDAGWAVLPLEGHPDTHYIVDGALALREPTPFSISKNLIQADGADAAVVSGFPAGCSIWFGGQFLPIEDTTVELKSTQPGTVAAILIGPKPHYKEVPISVIAED